MLNTGTIKLHERAQREQHPPASSVKGHRSPIYVRFMFASDDSQSLLFADTGSFVILFSYFCFY